MATNLELCQLSCASHPSCFCVYIDKSVRSLQGLQLHKHSDG